MTSSTVTAEIRPVPIYELPETQSAPNTAINYRELVQTASGIIAHGTYVSGKRGDGRYYFEVFRNNSTLLGGIDSSYHLYSFQGARAIDDAGDRSIFYFGTPRPWDSQPAKISGVNIVDALRMRIASLFRNARRERFSPGKDSDFSQALKSEVLLSVKSLDAISELIFSRNTSPEVASEALKWLGDIEDSRSHRYRRWVLEKGLGSGSVRVRDGATIGIELMHDKQSVPALRKAMNAENCYELRDYMEQVLGELDES